MDLDEIERLAQACVDATQKIDAAPNAYTRWDAEQEAHAPYEDLGLHGADVLALIARLRAAESPWQPMDTAPRGKWVLMYVGQTVYKAARCGDECVEVGGLMIHPTAWMPLPEPPHD